MSAWNFILYEFFHHPVSDIGVGLFIVASFLVFISYKKYSNYKNDYLKSHNTVDFRAWISNHKLLLLFNTSFLFFSMVLARPLFTYYSSIIEWIGGISFIGIILQILWHYNNVNRQSISWDAYANDPHFYKHNGVITCLKNKLGPFAPDTVINIKLGIGESDLTGKIDMLAFLQKPIQSIVLKSVDRNRVISATNNKIIFNILKDKINESGNYYCQLKYIQQDNKNNENVIDFYFHFDSSDIDKSYVINDTIHDIK